MIDTKILEAFILINAIMKYHHLSTKKKESVVYSRETRSSDSDYYEKYGSTQKGKTCHS